MKIKVRKNEKVIIYELNDSQAAKDLYSQLPLKINIKDFSTNEKIFYPVSKLNVTNTPIAKAEKGTMAYYAPWGNVVMFYDYFGSGNGLYELGVAVSGKEYIEGLSGTIEIIVEE